MWNILFFLLASLASSVTAIQYFPEWEDYNLNQNKDARSPLEYSGKWDGHQYTVSPTNWRFPFYTIFLDRFVNGDPSNDNINGTQFEVDPLSNQLRAGGDITGLYDSLDYLQGMGIKGLYLAGSPFINQPWSADSYSPLDLTLLDWHFGNITAWRQAIDEIHRRGMYVVMDNTMSTMGDLIGFDGYLNTTTPFAFQEHHAVWKSSRRYWDFDVKEDVVEDCVYPRFWDELGNRIGSNVTSQMTTCLNSDFDQYGDVESFGQYPEWQKQLSKFGFVQDRLREWRPSVMDKIKHFSCLTMKMLDIDGFRIDKGLTITLDAQADWSDAMRQCAKDLGKTNFFIPGEIVSGNALAALYIGRGKEPQMSFSSPSEAMTAQNTSDPELYIRNSSALDSAAFHYSVYRSLTRLLGIDGEFAAEADIRLGFADGWDDMLKTNDMINTNTGHFDPRHLYGVSNQDVFRWPAIRNGTNKSLLGLFITTMIMPGIPILTWGEEQALYVLENTAGNYLYGRQPLTSTLAWQMHGCYKVGSEKYNNFPLDSTLRGCEDDSVSLDHRDPAHPLRNILRRMYELRSLYPVLNDGFEVDQLSNHTYDILLPGSGTTATQTGLWSYVRRRSLTTQDFKGQGAGNQMVWILFGNEDSTKTYELDCNSGSPLVSPFDAGTTVKNLFYPYEEYTLQTSKKQLKLENSTAANGCLPKLDFPAWGFKAFVPKAAFTIPKPVITKFLPGHDFRYKSTTTADGKENVDIQVLFSIAMDCASVQKAISIESKTADGSIVAITKGTIQCGTIDSTTTQYTGETGAAWSFKATLNNVANGVHRISIANATSASGTSTGSTDHFLIRVGQTDNPMTFPRQANYSTSLAQKIGNDLIVSHRAAGADKFRCTSSWGSDWTSWLPYTGQNYTMHASTWSGTTEQEWEGDHVVCQYWSKLTGSSHHQQEGNAQMEAIPRRFPHVFVHGAFNEFGFDSGLQSRMTLAATSQWTLDLSAEWPTNFQFNIWGVNPDGVPDQTLIYGDVDGDHILDRVPPSSLIQNVVNITSPPPMPYAGWHLTLDDRAYSYSIQPMGSALNQIAIFCLLWIIPILTACAVAYAFMRFFYGIKFNKLGAALKPKSIIPMIKTRKAKRPVSAKTIESTSSSTTTSPTDIQRFSGQDAWQQDAGAKRRTVLIATMEYDIEDWKIKIKIGGLGVMAQLMGKSLGHQDLIWVVPCVGGVDYPNDATADPMHVEIMGETYTVNVQYHTLRNITYVLLDAPVFRQQTVTDPYPPRMDDLDSAIYYSTWNQCIAQAIKRFPVDLYHINDYHGSCAPLYLLPEVIPCALSLHNAEFQGLWPMRSEKESKEVCEVFNLDRAIVKTYVQFGEVFNLLHAAARYLRMHQKGFGAVGVSRKYGKRSYARYPIFWGLSKIQALPNPDPTDTAAWRRSLAVTNDAEVDPDYEATRGNLRRQAQEWAGLEQDPTAELFVFVGRWSMQKGVDLIADCFPTILENYPKAQLIAIGPVIDLYGKFAALKLEKLMELYPGRVYSKPEFTALPPYIFSGAEFALIPSRDEPFGLVAVEFGRKGALGVGSRVGGLGQMPGWWFTVESMTTKHLIQQFKLAIHDALGSSQKLRALMRARSAKQRFPVAQWVEDLNALQSKAIKMSVDQKTKPRGLHAPSLISLTSRPVSRAASPMPPQMVQKESAWPLSNEPLVSPQFPFTNSANLQVPQNNSLKHVSSWSNLRASHDLSTPNLETGGSIYGAHGSDSHHGSTLSLNSIIGDRKDFALQKVDPFFTDADGYAKRNFERKLESLDAGNSEVGLCIEDYLVKSEKKWFNEFKNAKAGLTSSRNSSTTSLHKLGKGLNSRNSSITSLKTLSIFNGTKGQTSTPADPIKSPKAHPLANRISFMPYESNKSDDEDSEFDDDLSEIDESSERAFDLGHDYVPPTGLKRFMLRKIYDWPVYTFFLAFGQIIAANSYQITLLTGENGQTATQLYIIASLYAVMSVAWWLVYRRLSSIWCLSLPFVFYGLSFLFVGIAPFVSNYAGRGWVQHIASGWYTVASASGSLYFALNFGDEGGAPVKTWVWRACVIQGTQQIYVSALWYWGASLTKLSKTGAQGNSASSMAMTAICIPIALLMWAVGFVLYAGLPTYYKQTPGSVPSFYKSILRRKIILWFFVAVIIQNYWLSAPYGRNWRFLWTTQHASSWEIVLLVAFFFIGIWGLCLFTLGRLSKAHSWILPIFAIGLGAPRWAQMLWGISGVGSYLPWTGSASASALLSRGLWLWLGVLDALQGVGFGMILLQTMTRFHNTFTLIAAQVLGSIATIVGRATAPDRIGPGTVFPNFALGYEGLQQPAFWICLVLQIAICVGFAAFFRKEQLSKP